MPKVKFVGFVHLNKTDKRKERKINQQLHKQGLPLITLTKTANGKYGFATSLVAGSTNSIKRIGKIVKKHTSKR